MTVTTMAVRMTDRLQCSAEQVKLVLVVRACCAAKELLRRFCSGRNAGESCALKSGCNRHVSCIAPLLAGLQNVLEEEECLLTINERISEGKECFPAMC